jgi:hypothetical protein
MPNNFIDQENYYLNRIFVACKKTGLVLVDKLWSWPKLIMCDPNMASTLTARIGSYISALIKLSEMVDESGENRVKKAKFEDSLLHFNTRIFKKCASLSHDIVDSLALRIKDKKNTISNLSLIPVYDEDIILAVFYSSTLFPSTSEQNPPFRHEATITRRVRTEESRTYLGVAPFRSEESINHFANNLFEIFVNKYGKVFGEKKTEIIKIAKDKDEGRQPNLDSLALFQDFCIDIENFLANNCYSNL